MKSLTNSLLAGAIAGAIALLGPASFAAAEPQTLLTQWQSCGGLPFSASRGQKLFNARGGSDWACSTCHTADPRQPGRHATTSKPIKPLAPAANAARFTDAAKVEKWFRRNCNDVLGRECTPTEKGDVLTWLMSLR